MATRKPRSLRDILVFLVLPADVQQSAVEAIGGARVKHSSITSTTMTFDSDLGTHRLDVMRSITRLAVG